MNTFAVRSHTWFNRIRRHLPGGESHSILTLAFVSAFACFLLALRTVIQMRLQHLYLPWNLFLAWLPLVFAWGSVHLARRHGWRHWRPWAMAVAWLLFLPNAPYIFTDLVHLGPVPSHRFWIDMILILMFAWPGFLVGCVSLRMMQREVTRYSHAVIGWLFALAVCGLAGVGVYIGRFQRWNSWDVVANPLQLASDMIGLVTLPITHPAYRFSILFGALMFVGYATLQADQFRHVPQRRAERKS